MHKGHSGGRSLRCIGGEGGRGRVFFKSKTRFSTLSKREGREASLLVRLLTMSTFRIMHSS